MKEPKRRPSLDSVSPPQLAPLKGPLHLYGQRALGETSPTPGGQVAPIQTLPGALLPKQLTPISAGLSRAPTLRSVSVLAPPALPPIGEQVTSPFTSSDENVNSTSETEGGGTTSEEGRAKHRISVTQRPLLQSPLPGVLRPPPLRQPSVPVLPPLPSMPPSRRVSTDPFAVMSPLPERPTASFPLTRTVSQVSSNLPDIRRPLLPAIPATGKEGGTTTEAETRTTTDDTGTD